MALSRSSDGEELLMEDEIELGILTGSVESLERVAALFLRLAASALDMLSWKVCKKLRWVSVSFGIIWRWELDLCWFIILS